MIIQVQNWGFAPKEKMREIFGFEWSGTWETPDSFPPDFFELAKHFDVFIRERGAEYSVFLDKKGGSFRTR